LSARSPTRTSQAAALTEARPAEARALSSGIGIRAASAPVRAGLALAAAWTALPLPAISLLPISRLIGRAF
jgi:hypothetical protein